MDLVAFRASLVAAFQALFPTNTLKVDSHPGRFELGELKRYSGSAPCLLVAVLNWPLDGLSLASGPVEVAAYLVTKSKREGKHDELNLSIASVLLRHLAASGIGGRAATQTRWGNLYTGALGDEGISLSGISFRQHLMLDLPGNADTTLGSFKTLFATWDIAGDSQPEAQNQITLEGA